MSVATTHHTTPSNSSEQLRRSGSGLCDVTTVNGMVVSPSARYYYQTAADFYAIQFPGDPINNPDRVPHFYSADYRLSEMETFTLGLEATVNFGRGCRDLVRRAASPAPPENRPAIEHLQIAE